MAEQTLPGLKAGEFGTVSSVLDSQGSAKRLADLGFVHGACVMMVRPGEPCVVRLGGRCVGLGGGHQQSILLSPE